MKRKVFWKFRHILIVLGALIIGIGGVTLAKYIAHEFHSYYLDSKHFYFTSNRLTSDNALYQVNNWSGVGSFNISFDLLSQKNTYVYTNYDIPYQVSVTCPNDVVCTLSQTTGTIYSSSTTHSATVTLSVNPQRNYAENEVLTIHIVASSTSPYVKTLTADFQYIVGKQGVTYEIEDEANRAYMILKVTSAISYCTVTEAFGNYAVGATIDNSVYRTLSKANKNKCASKRITLGFNVANLLLDTTSNIIDISTYTTTTVGGVDYINSLTFGIGPVSTVAIKFYKVDPTQNYTYPIVNNSSIVNVTINNPI